MLIELRAVAAVAVGAGLGGVARFLLGQLVVAQFGPGQGYLATLAINVSGSFLIGIVIEVAQLRPHLDPAWRLFLATGILGGYTTFSTFSYEVLALASSGRPGISAAYLAGSVVLGILAALAGIGLARAFAA